MPEEEKKEEKETEEEEFEKELEEELEELEEEEEEQEFASSEIKGVPSILCPDDYVLMEIDGTEIRETEERKFVFMTNTVQHDHLKYVCPECEKYFYYDLERQRQGCFIATAAYGTPMAEDINVLRRFRDSYLVHREWGKKLVSAYYTLSPPVANLIGKSDTLKKIVRTSLKPLIKFFRKREKSQKQD